MLTAISLRYAIESPKSSQSSLKRAVCLQNGSVQAEIQCLDLDETQLDMFTFGFFLFLRI